MQDQLNVAWAFAELELSFGGDGNGLYLSGPDKCVKGITEMATELAILSAKQEGIGFFHTRKASCGGVRSELCHPFLVEGDAGKYAVMHNGHWMPWYSYSDDGEKTDTQTMANLVAKYGIEVLASDAAKDSGVWVVYDRDIERSYVIRRSGQFWLQRLNKLDDSDPPVFFHASEPMRSVQNWRRGCGLIREDLFYELRLTGRAKEKHGKGYEPIEPERKKTPVYTSNGYGGSHHPYIKPWWENKELHVYAWGFDGKGFACFCTEESEWLCIRCQDHFKEYGELPVYEEDRDFVESLADDDERLYCGLPAFFKMGELPEWVTKMVERRTEVLEQKRKEEAIDDDVAAYYESVYDAVEGGESIVLNDLDAEREAAKEDARERQQEKKEQEQRVASSIKAPDTCFCVTNYVCYACRDAADDDELEEPTRHLAIVPAKAIGTSIEEDQDFLAPSRRTYSSGFPFVGQFLCMTSGCTNWTDMNYCEQCVDIDDPGANDILIYDNCQECDDWEWFKSSAVRTCRRCLMKTLDLSGLSIPYMPFGWGL